MRNSFRALTVIVFAIGTSGMAATDYCQNEVQLCGNGAVGIPCVIALYLDQSQSLQVDRGRVYVGPLTTIQWTTKEGSPGDTFAVDFPNGGTPFADDAGHNRGTHFDGHKNDVRGKQTNQVCPNGHTDCGCYRVYKYTATLTINSVPKTIDPDVIIDPGGGGHGKSPKSEAAQKKTPAPKK